MSECVYVCVRALVFINKCVCTCIYVRTKKSKLM